MSGLGVGGSTVDGVDDRSKTLFAHQGPVLAQGLRQLERFECPGRELVNLATGLTAHPLQSLGPHPALPHFRPVPGGFLATWRCSVGTPPSKTVRSTATWTALTFREAVPGERSNAPYTTPSLLT